MGAHILVGSRKDLFLRDACLYLFTYGGGHAVSNRLFLFAHLCFRLCAGGPSCLLLHLYLYSSCHFCRHFCAGLFRCGFQRRAADLLLYIRQNGGIVFARHWGIAETGPRQQVLQLRVGRRKERIENRARAALQRRALSRQQRQAAGQLACCARKPGRSAA